MVLLLFGCSTIPEDDRYKQNTLISVPIGHIPIALPDNQADRIELGVAHLADEGFFRMNQMDCKILVVEVFDLYCHICQSSAENLNILHANLSVPPFNSLVCMFGIGKENTDMEVNSFRSDLKVEFPMLPDPSSLFAQAIPVVHTPHIMVLQKDGDAYQIVQQKVGYFSREDIDDFTELIISLTTQ